VAAGVLDEGGGAVEAHGLVVEEAGHEFGGAVGFEPGAGVGEEREAHGVGLGETVEGEVGGGLDEYFGDAVRPALFAHGGAQGGEAAFEAFGAAGEAHGAAQLFGLGAVVVGELHGAGEHLFLEEHDAVGAFEDGEQAFVDFGVEADDGFAAVAAGDNGVDKLADDGAGAHDGDLHGDVVEAGGFEATEAGHLGAAFDLEDANGIGFLHHFIRLRIVGREGVEGEFFAAVGAEFEAVLEGGHHAEAEQVDFDDAEVFAVVFVPLQDDAVGHGGGLERDDLIEATAADDHTAGVLSEVAGEAVELLVKFGEGGGARVSAREAGFGELFFEFEGMRKVAAVEEAGEAVHDVVGETEDFAEFAGGAAAAVGDDVGGHGGAVGGVAAVNFLDDGFAEFAAGEVEIDVGPGGAAVGVDATFAEEAFKEEAIFYRIDGGDTEGVADDAIGGGASALREDAVGAGPFAEVGDDEEVAAETEFLDEGEFGVDLAAVVGGDAGDEIADAGVDESVQERGHGVPGRHGKFGELVAEVLEGEVEAVGEAGGVGDGVGEVGEFPGHEPAGADLAFGVGGEEAAGAVEGGVVS